MNPVSGRLPGLSLLVILGMTGAFAAGAHGQPDNGIKTRLDSAISALEAGNYETARKDFQDLTQAGSMAEYYLGYMSQNGKGCAKDPKGAISFYKKAADNDVVDAQNALAGMYCAGEGTEKSPSKGIQFYLKAANQDDRKAQAELGRIYAGGGALPKDLVVAYQWLFLADRASDADPSVGILGGKVLGQMTELQIQVSKILIHQWLEDHDVSLK